MSSSNDNDGCVGVFYLILIGTVFIVSIILEWIDKNWDSIMDGLAVCLWWGGAVVAAGAFYFLASYLIEKRKQWKAHREYKQSDLFELDEAKKKIEVRVEKLVSIVQKLANQLDETKALRKEIHDDLCDNPHTVEWRIKQYRVLDKVDRAIAVHEKQKLSVEKKMDRLKACLSDVEGDIMLFHKRGVMNGLHMQKYDIEELLRQTDMDIRFDFKVDFYDDFDVLEDFDNPPSDDLKKEYADNSSKSSKNNNQSS